MATHDNEAEAFKRLYNQSQWNKLYLLTHVCGGLMILSVLSWIIEYNNGFGWTDPNQRFNWHPLCMTFGMIYLAGNSIISFRALRNQPKPVVKLIHGALHASAFVISAIGSLAVFSFHFEKNIANLYSLHSWIGALTMTMFFLQYVGGFYNFLFPTTSLAFRAWVLPYHVLNGFFIFGLAVVACVSGLTEKAIFNEKYPYASFTGATFVVNFAGVFLIAFAVLVFYLGTQSQFKRRNPPESQPLTRPRHESTSPLESPSN